MISVEGLKVEFGVKPLFSNVSFVINNRDRVALVGKNGAGKSTLLKILSGKQQPTAGVVAIPNDTTIGYLPQVMQIANDTTVKEETRKAFANTLKLKQKLQQMQNEMAIRTDYESADYLSLVEQFTQEHERFMMLGGENYEAEIDRTLIGLGFKETDFNRPTSEFSGGWRMRIELAKILLQHPDVLLLDEPTNHLDIESIQWLEQFLLQSAKAVVLVSHDRAFINNVTNRTLEITCAHIEDYKVKYNQYITLRAERREQQLRAYENQQKEIADTKAFIERFRYQATKAVQVQQRIRQLEKIIPIQVDQVDNKRMHLKFPPCLRSGNYPIICDNLRKDYGNHNVFHHVTFTIKRGEKVAFVGKNGEGKSTLVKCIMNQIPFNGTLKVGHNVQIGYFAQNQAQLLNQELTIYETIDSVATGDMRLKINDLLGAFMFGGETSEKKVKVLSGGERSRLAMIRLLLQPVNLLILDEPTNHLDMASKDVLKEAIKAFDGTVILVSHDRDFLDGLVDKVYEFGNGIVKEHLGGIYDFIQTKSKGVDNTNLSHSIDAILQQKTTIPTTIDTTNTGEQTKEKSGAEEYQQRKEQQKRIRKIKRDIEQCEKDIENMEKRIDELNKLLSQPEHASNMQLVTEYTTIQQALTKQNDKWLELNQQLENDKIE